MKPYHTGRLLYAKLNSSHPQVHISRQWTRRIWHEATRCLDPRSERDAGARIPVEIKSAGSDDVVDGDEDELDEEPDESHHHETYHRPQRHLGELCTPNSYQNSVKSSQPNTRPPRWIRARNHPLPLRSGLWQRLTRRTLSLANSRRGSTTESIASMATWRDLEARRACVTVWEREVEVCLADASFYNCHL